MAAPKKVTVDGVAIELVAQNEARMLLTITNLSGVDIFLGDSSAVTVDGDPLLAGARLVEERTEENVDQYYFGAYFAISAGSADVRVWEKERIRNV